MDKLQFDINNRTELCLLMAYYRSDKSIWHNYTLIYDELFKDIRYDKIRLFELGLGTLDVNIVSHMTPGFLPLGSLCGWRNYFQNGIIYGADIDKSLIVEQDRLKTFYCDQRDKLIIEDLWNNEELKNGFDIIIDDGSHIFEDSCIFLENSIHKLNKNGYYIIEDLDINLLNKYIDKINNEWSHKYNDLKFNIYDIDNKNNPGDNRLLIIYKFL
jgi:hypothetical protein